MALLGAVLVLCCARLGWPDQTGHPAMLPDLLATQRSELLAELRSKLVEYSGDRILMGLVPATVSDLPVASAPFPYAGAFLGWIRHPELGWCGATAFIAYEEEEYCVFEFRKLLRRAGGLLPRLDRLDIEDGVRQSEPDAAKWISALTANVGKSMMDRASPEWVFKLAPNAMRYDPYFHEFGLEDMPTSTWILEKIWSKSIQLAESLGWDEPSPVTKQSTPGSTDDAKSREQQKKSTIRQRMAVLLYEKPESKDWTVTQFQQELKCSRAAIHDTPTWQMLARARKAERVERQPDRRRNRNPQRTDRHRGKGER